MVNDCYQIPTSFGALIKRESIGKLSEQESIEQHIALYLGTKPGEFHYSPDFGCILHNYTFTQLNETTKKDELKRSIEDYLKDFEKRIDQAQVSVTVQDILEVSADNKPGTNSRRIKVTVNCRLRKTSELLPEMKFNVVRYS